MSKTQNFVIWLQGVLDANSEGGLDTDKTKMVKDKLNTLFHHEANEKPRHKRPRPTLKPEYLTGGRKRC